MTRHTALRAAITLAAAIFLAANAFAQKPDRSAPPKPAPPPALKLPPVQKQTLSNGLAVWIVEQHEVPIAQVNLIVRAGSGADPVGKYGIASMTANMLDEGAGGKSALELADAIEFLGAQLGTSSTFDYSAVRLSTPVTKLNDALSLMADVVMRPSFPDAELERLRKERLTRLLQARDDPAAIIDLAFPRLVFGDKHRYGTSAGGGTDLTAEEQLLVDDKHVCRGLNTCKGLGRSKENACAGQGTCASIADHACAQQNECKGQGGCGADPAFNACKGMGGCHVPLMDEAWTKARAAFEAAMKKSGKTVGAAPAKA